MKNKPRCGGRLTEAGYWGLLRGALRRQSMYWKVRGDCLDAAKVPYTGDNKRRRVSFVCAICKERFKRDDVQVDHIVPAGSLKTYDDVKGFVERLLCEIDNLQVLCKPCHNVKTKEEKK